MPADVKAMAEKTAADIKSGALKPFGGKITKQDGSVVGRTSTTARSCQVTDPSRASTTSCRSDAPVSGQGGALPVPDNEKTRRDPPRGPVTAPPEGSPIAYAADWMNILTRWFHLIVDIGWIGTSFTSSPSTSRSGRVPPPRRPAPPGSFTAASITSTSTPSPRRACRGRRWYKWDAYLPSSSSIVLMAVQYWLSARLPDRPQDPGDGALGDLAVDRLAHRRQATIVPLAARPPHPGARRRGLRAPSSTTPTSIPAAARLIHVGAFVGTIMAANVFRVIIPNQRKIVDQLIAGPRPPTAASARSPSSARSTTPI